MKQTGIPKKDLCSLNGEYKNVSSCKSYNNKSTFSEERSRQRKFLSNLKEFNDKSFNVHSLINDLKYTNNNFIEQ